MRVNQWTFREPLMDVAAYYQCLNFQNFLMADFTQHSLPFVPFGRNQVGKQGVIRFRYSYILMLQLICSSQANKHWTLPLTTFITISYA